MGWSKVKDPQATRLAEWDWTSWLGTGETILTATVTPDTGITVSSVTHNDTTVTCTVAGGTAGMTYRIVCHVTTTAGQQDDDTLTIRVRDR